MSTVLDIDVWSTYRGVMFTTRMRRFFSSVTRHVDVMPDTLVLRAWETPSSRSRV